MAHACAVLVAALLLCGFPHTPAAQLVLPDTIRVSNFEYQLKFKGTSSCETVPEGSVCSASQRFVTAKRVSATVFTEKGTGTLCRARARASPGAAGQSVAVRALAHPPGVLPASVLGRAHEPLRSAGPSGSPAQREVVHPPS